MKLGDYLETKKSDDQREKKIQVEWLVVFLTYICEVTFEFLCASLVKFCVL